MKPKRGRACVGKQQIPSESAARAIRARLIAQGAFAANLRVYRCPFSPRGNPHWHVGHPTGSAQSK